MKIVDMELSSSQMLSFFCVANLIFVIPLMLADYLYIDDSWRTQSAGLGWADSGRILVEWLYKGLSFTSAAPNIFPLPLLICVVVMAFALRALVVSFFLRPTLSSCFVVLPLWYSPYFLQSLSYQYDGPAMGLGVAAVIFSIAYKGRSLFSNIVVPAILLAVGLSFYQVVINVYIGLVCIERLMIAHDQQSLYVNLIRLRDRLLQLLVALLIYLATAFQLMTEERTAMRQFADGWPVKLVADLKLASQRVGLLYHEDNAWLCGLLILLAVAGFCIVVRGVLLSADRVSHKIIHCLLCICVVPVVLLSIPGIALAFDYFNDEARLMMGVSTLLVLILFLSYRALRLIHVNGALLLVVPLMAMLSFSYAHGRMLSLHKTLGESVARYLSYDLISHADLRRVKVFYMVRNSTKGWLVGGDGTMSALPFMRYVVNMSFILLPEMLPRIGGVNNVLSMEEKKFRSVSVRCQENIIVANKFYDVCTVGESGYVVMKLMDLGDVYISQ
ncbi:MULTISPECIES: glucosyltransferase domain-containing protein [Pseudomonas]|uniref:Glucosyl transferase GtrII n=6 Tax=Pseudomonas gessardii TaxID=78544 RepID=A0ABS9F5E3_9PSED|nr:MULTISPECIES: glucosyltransferase domain-containing protein [Pseudomonas]MBH3420834.1 glucosyltransferase domain-containing protein [Pseudomonas gessardii]MCF5094336.1 hypothetical protein [Pseudomonas gessardii]MCF5106978.1 hypothetical protein [Pseudomonas gessardii]NNA65118.1 hypothetical protein [Pseudomonas gessardii]NNA88418.1 hypothetical protein [Pseudomonas gessardii]